MRIKEITVGAKRSCNFQTYEVSITAEFKDGNIPEVCTDAKIKELQTRCRKLANEQIALDMPKRVDITPKYPEHLKNDSQKFKENRIA